MNTIAGTTMAAAISAEFRQPRAMRDTTHARPFELTHGCRCRRGLGDDLAEMTLAAAPGNGGRSVLARLMRDGYRPAPAMVL
jgi:hypothetical protein